MKTITNKVIVATKSNYNNLNYVPLVIHEIIGTRVSVLHEGVVIDFNIKEVVSFVN